MNEPIYTFVKGKGWVINHVKQAFAPNYYMVPWVRHSSVDDEWFIYPEFCKDWEIVERCTDAELQVGDIIPCGPRHFYVITGITETKIRRLIIYSDSSFEEQDRDRHDLPWRCIARQPA